MGAAPAGKLMLAYVLRIFDVHSELCAALSGLQ